MARMTGHDPSWINSIKYADDESPQIRNPRRVYAPCSARDGMGKAQSLKASLDTKAREIQSHIDAKLFQKEHAATASGMMANAALGNAALGNAASGNAGGGGTRPAQLSLVPELGLGRSAAAAAGARGGAGARRDVSFLDRLAHAEVQPPTPTSGQ